MRKFLKRTFQVFLFPVIAITVSFAYDDPVRWLYVKTKINFNNSVAVNWGVMSEPYDRRFEIERSEDGSSFGVLAGVPGRGSSSGDNHYAVTDNSVRTGVTYYYRVSVIGPDGIPRYSPVVHVRLDNDEEDDLVRLHPNPATETVFIKINKERAGSGQIIISDISGVTRFSCRVEKSSGSETPLSLQVGTWPRGMYLLRIITPYGDSQVERFFVKY